MSGRPRAVFVTQRGREADGASSGGTGRHCWRSVSNPPTDAPPSEQVSPPSVNGFDRASPDSHQQNARAELALPRVAPRLDSAFG